MAEEFKDLRKRIDRIKKNVTMAALIKHFGGRVWNEKRPCQVRCPFPDHDDVHPSARVFPDSNVLHCFVCGFHGDVLDATEKFKSVGRAGAVAYLEQVFGLSEVALADKVVTAWTNDTIARKLNEDRVRDISDQLYKIRQRIPFHKQYVWWIWSDFIWMVYDEGLETVGGMQNWYRFSIRCIDKYLAPLSKEIDDMILHGGVDGVKIPKLF